MISNNQRILTGFKTQPTKLKGEVKKPVVQPNVEHSTPVDKVVALKTPRPGSSMAQMVEDLQNNGIVPKPKTEEATPKPLKKAREGSDMAQMVEDLNRHKTQSNQTVAVGANGTLAILEDPYIAGHTDDHGHEHGPNNGDALLQGHLGTEVVEQVAHKASHGAHHVADAVGHKTTLTSHLADTAAQKTTTVTGHLSDLASQKSGHLTDAVTSKVSHVAQGVGHKANQLADTLTGSTADIAEAGHHGAVKHMDSVSETAGHASELSNGLQVALGASSLLSFGLAIPLAKNAIKELKHGWKQLKAGIKKKGLRKAVKEGDGVLPLAEGVGGSAVAVRSVAASTVMANMTSVGQAVPGLSSVASVASKVLMPLGIIHAGVDIAVGAHEFKNGKKTEGLMKMGFGFAVGGAAITHALPFTIAAITLLGGKIVHGVVKNKRAKKAAALAEAQAPNKPVPETPSDRDLNKNPVTMNSPPRS